MIRLVSMDSASGRAMAITMRVVASGIPESSLGTAMALEFVIEFLRWADDAVPSHRKIMERFGVSRATAYRYRRAYQTALEKYGSLKFERTPRRS